ncbi:MAG: acyltransferase [Sphingobacteriales bacterium]|nr:MAG: acyltransferase [Sphingobacteriales bacterium]
MAFYTKEQLHSLGFRSFGENVSISDRASIYKPSQISIGDNVRIDDFCILSAGDGGIVIGDHVHIACYVSIIGKGKVTISDFAGISSRSAIYSSNDDYSGDYLTGPTIPPEFTNVKHSDVMIGKHVVLGVNVTVLPGISIGEGAAIGAYSLVNKSIEPGIIAVGVPAKEIKKRGSAIFDLEKQLKVKHELGTP